MSIPTTISVKGKSYIQKHTAHRYAMDVVSGKQPASKYARLACERYLKDLATAEANGWYFDHKEADFVIQWFPKFLKHTKGAFAGQPFELLPWQQFIIWNIFGWYHKSSGARRFTSAYIEVPKKNGKTTFCSGIMLYMLLGDAEDSPEVYCAATHRDQAKIAFDEATKMAKSSPQIAKLIKQVRNKIACHRNYGIMVPLSSDANSSDGLNVSCGIIDEYHAHRTSEVHDIVKSGTIARKHPLFAIITTAGFSIGGPCHLTHKVCRDILEEKLEDNSRFIIMYSIDEPTTEGGTDGDDWKSEEAWKKANPSLGSGVLIEKLREQFKSAINEGGTKEVNFKTKFLNIWVGSSKTWIQDEYITRCMVEDMPDVKGIACFGGLDLANTRDIAALTLRWELPDGKVYDKTWYWLPQERLDEVRMNNDKHPYLQYARDGYIMLTPGNTTDYDSIRRFITGYCVEDGVVKYDDQCIMQQYSVRKIAYDRWNASQLVLNLKQDGVDTLPYGQGYADMGFPSKTLEKEIVDNSNMYTMDANPVTRWMFGNVAMTTDPAGNIKPDKQKSSEKIDGIVSKIMACGCHIHCKHEESTDMPNDYQMTIL